MKYGQNTLKTEKMSYPKDNRLEYAYQIVFNKFNEGLSTMDLPFSFSKMTVAKYHLQFLSSLSV